MSFTSRCASLGAILCVIAGLSHAQDAKTAIKRDPKVQAVIDQMLAAYKSLGALHLKISVKINGPTDMFAGAPDSVELRLQKPNKLFLASSAHAAKTGLDRKLIVSDGSSLWLWTSVANTYTKAKASATLKGVTTLGDDLPEFEILFNDKDPFADIPGATAMTLAAPAKLGDVDVDVLTTKVAEPGVPFTLAVQLMVGQKDHLLHAMVFEGSGKDPMGKDTKFDLHMTYDVVNTAPVFAPTDFTFVPPAGSKLAPAIGIAKPVVPAAAQKPPAKK